MKIDITTIPHGCQGEAPTHICILPLVSGNLITTFGYDIITVYLIDHSGIRVNLLDEIQTCIRKEVEEEMIPDETFITGRGIIIISHDKTITIQIEHNGIIHDEDDLFPFYTKLHSSLRSLLMNLELGW